jgi:hypothetical protein
MVPGRDDDVGVEIIWSRTLEQKKSLFYYYYFGWNVQKTSKKIVLPVVAQFWKNGAGRGKANGREPKTGLGRVFNCKLGCVDDVRVLIYADTRPHLQLKFENLAQV